VKVLSMRHRVDPWGHEYLEAEVEVTTIKTAKVYPYEAKEHLLEKHIIFLGADFEELVEPLILSRSKNKPLYLRGFIMCEKLADEVRRVLDRQRRG